MTSFLDYRKPKPAIYIHATQPVERDGRTVRLRAGKWRYTVKAFADEACKKLRYETCYERIEDGLKMGLTSAIAKIFAPKMKAGEIAAIAVIDHETDEVRFAYASPAPVEAV